MAEAVLAHVVDGAPGDRPHDGETLAGREAGLGQDRFVRLEAVRVEIRQLVVALVADLLRPQVPLIAGRSADSMDERQVQPDLAPGVIGKTLYRWAYQMGLCELPRNMMTYTRVPSNGQPTIRTFTMDELKLLWAHSPQNRAPTGTSPSLPRPRISLTSP